MMGAANPVELLERLMLADQFGVKLEIVQGNPTWEFFPGPIHQGTVGDIHRSVRPRSDCEQNYFFALSDAYVQFKDGSVKRPDLMVFCEKPELTRQALTVIPEAVVEVLSPGTEKKDLDVGPPFYLSQGVKDVVVVNPETHVVYHIRKDGARRLEGPVTIQLECGCELDA
ncbi:Uma2 family endonuclease [Fimbriimonas ginsengisoli]|uniref:Putative restriction endonuclease domain-containing protein n=1 Tax=Fimbriimonas ginsengisoli Gsoil 348 TaxID=661478 RepID=A0A068NRV8_FIMGI|nr:Uma2 family endonuclease [Fimbriimonas ginsengisoli]AIE86293.1 hypothetical protein OP10G_2925 [Fimbriimonas ginsengisoli Gsoil 348]